MSTRGHFAFWSLFILALPVLGQRPSRSGIGLKAGPQGTNLFGSDKVYKPIPGVVGGIYFPLWVGARFELQPELLLSYQGSQLPDAENGPGRMRMLYLCLPLNAKLYLSNALNIQGGVQESRILKEPSIRSLPPNASAASISALLPGWVWTCTQGLI